MIQNILFELSYYTVVDVFLENHRRHHGRERIHCFSTTVSNLEGRKGV